MNLVFSRQIFGKFPVIKVHENPSSGSRVVPHGQQMDTRTDMTKLVVFFFAVLGRHLINVDGISIAFLKTDSSSAVYLNSKESCPIPIHVP